MVLPDAEILRLDAHAEQDGFVFTYDVDGRFVGAIDVGYPFELDAADRALLAPIGFGIAVFLGQLCRARRLHPGFVVSDAMVATLRPLAEMLYDIRSWKDGVELAPPIEIVTRAGSPEPPVADLVCDRACLLFSGGKDSSLSALVLRRNGLDVEAVHIPANAHVHGHELEASAALGRVLDLGLRSLRFAFPGFQALSNAYAATWNQFPHYNAVPFGRDLLLAVLAAPCVRRARAGALCLGHDHDCRVAKVTHCGKRIPRNDVESVEGALVLEEYYRRFLVPGLRYLPPLAQLTEHRILYEMLVHHADVMAQTAFCFWKRRCGRCAKCLRYALAQRAFGRDGVLNFDVNPLRGDACPELVDYFRAGWSPDALFSNGVSFCLARLVERGDVRPGETLVTRFAEEVYPRLAAGLADAEVEIMRGHPDPQVPEDWIVSAG